jgi:hypothetical protein
MTSRFYLALKCVHDAVAATRPSHGHRISVPRCRALARRARLRLAAPGCVVTTLLPSGRAGHGQVPTMPLSHEIFTRARCLPCCMQGRADAAAPVAPVPMQPTATPSSPHVHARPPTTAASLLLLASTKPRCVTVACAMPVPLAANAEPSRPPRSTSRYHPPRTLPLRPRCSRLTSVPGQLHAHGRAPFGHCQPRPRQKTETAIMIVTPSSTATVLVGSVQFKAPGSNYSSQLKGMAYI